MEKPYRELIFIDEVGDVMNVREHQSIVRIVIQPASLSIMPMLFIVEYMTILKLYTTVQGIKL